MSRRMHKAMGYGLRGFKPDRHFHECCVASTADFSKWCANHLTEIGTATKDANFENRWQLGELSTELDGCSYGLHCAPDKYGGEGRWYPGSSVIYDDENIADLLLLIPPAFSASWFRYADSLDSIEFWHVQQHPQRQTSATELHDKLDRHPLGEYEEGKPPTLIVALMLWLGLGDRIQDLRETFYVWWG